MGISLLRNVVALTLLGWGIAQETNSTNTTDFTIDLSMLGNQTWSRLRPGWSLTVNDQCLYEFVFQFEHDDTLPIGQRNFEGDCRFKDPVSKKPFEADDGLPFLVPRKMWERLPRYVWATIGFNHLSVDWYPCGHFPRGYADAQYSFAFYRVTPEFRALAMTCDTIGEDEVTVPTDKICEFQQDSVNGMNFNVLPSALINKKLVVNMPETFERPELGDGPVPHVGLRSWDQSTIPETPNRWEDTPLFMSSYAGDLVMWEAKIPYKRLSGDSGVFTSNAYRYHEPTVEALPDTHAFHWDKEDGVIRFHMIGKASLCKAGFEAAQAAEGGPPVFPNWDDVFGTNTNGNGEGGDGSDGSNNGSSGFSPSALSCLVLFLVPFGLFLWTN